MKYFRTIFICFLVVSTQTAHAKKHPTPAPVVLVPPITDVTLDPLAIRERFLAGSTTVLQAATKVHRAKANLNVARAQLLPSINLVVLLGTLANPTFALATVQYMVPFLVPSKWFNLAAAKSMMKAEKIAFELSELNLYSSLYSMYVQILSDFKSGEFIAQDLRDTILIENIVSRAREVGSASEQDLQLARSETLTARIRLERFNELLSQEVASIRDALDYESDTQIHFADTSFPPSPLEDLDVASAVQLASQDAPELKQIEFLVASSKSEKWAKAFGFISNVSTFSGGNPGGGGQGGGGQGGVPGGIPGGVAGGTQVTTGASGAPDVSTAFNQQTASGAFTFGFDTFPKITLSNLDIASFLIRRVEAVGEISTLVETNLNRLQYIQNRKIEANQAEALLKSAFENARKKYTLGEISLRDLLNTQGKARQASLESLRADTDINLIRVTLYRLIRSNEFADIRGCEALPTKSPVRHWWNFWRRNSKKDAPICDPSAVTERFSGEKI